MLSLEIKIIHNVEIVIMIKVVFEIFGGIFEI
jgi:hypothetical protein